MARRPLESFHRLSDEDNLKLENTVALLQAAITLAGGNVEKEELLEASFRDVLRLIIPNHIEVRFRPANIIGF